MKGIVSSSIVDGSGKCNLTEYALYTNLFMFKEWILMTDSRDLRFELTIDDQVVKSSTQSKVSFIGDLMGPALENIKNLLYVRLIF